MRNALKMIKGGKKGEEGKVGLEQRRKRGINVAYIVLSISSQSEKTLSMAFLGQLEPLFQPKDRLIISLLIEKG